MKFYRSIVLVIFLTALLLVACGGETLAPETVAPVNEQEVAVAIGLTQTAVAISEEQPIPEPVVEEATAVATEAPLPQETAVCPFPEALTNHYGEDIVNDFLPYRSDLNGFCVYYPTNFTIGDEITDVQLQSGMKGNVVGIYGPALDESLDPVMASLNIMISDTDSADLTSFADQYAETTTFESRDQMDVNGVSAEVFRGVPGRSLTTQMFMMNNGRLYQLSFYPDDPAFPQAQPDLQSLITAVTLTWSFLDGSETSADAVPTKGTQYAYQGVSFMANPDLTGGDFVGEIVSREPLGEGPGHGFDRPETIRFTIPNSSPMPATIDIFPVDEYLGLFPAEWEIIDALQTLIAERPSDPPYKNYRFLPPPPATQVFNAQPLYLDFQNGAGLRYLTEYSQAVMPITPSYTFQGLTDDGKYYISAWMPVTTDALPPQDMDMSDIDAMLASMDARIADLDTLSDSDFDPALGVWDGLISSLLVTPENFPSPGGAVAGEIERCVNDAEFVQDVTIPDNTEIQPEEAFTKVWRVRNSGTCTWTQNYSPTFIGGDYIGTSSMSKAPMEVPPGGEAEISIEMTAPFAAGIHNAVWQMQSGNQLNFGDTFYLQIEVPQTEANKPVTDIPNFGVVEGAIAFPSEVVPAMTVYFVDVADEIIRYSLTTEDGWQAYSNELPVGSYYVFATLAGDSSGYAGGYTQAVPCGLTADCTDHSLLPVTLVEGEAITGIDVTDWYAPPGTFPLP